MLHLISIIIVNHNGSDFLPRLLKSIHRQKPSQFKFEVILVDTESTDLSIKIARSTMPSIKIVSVQNNGYGYAANKGAEKSTGDLICFFNEDMYLPNDFFSILLPEYNRLKNGTNIGCLGVKYCNFDQDPQHQPDDFGGTIDLLGFPKRLGNNEKQPLCVNGCPFLINRKLFIKLKGYCENIIFYSEDVDLSWRLALNNYQNFITNKTWLHHFGGANTNNFPKKRTVFALHGVGISLINNYSTPFLLLLYPLYLIIAILIVIILTVRYKTFQYLTFSLKMLSLCIMNYKKIFRFRSLVQSGRVVSDTKIIRQYFSATPSLLNSIFHKVSPR